MSILAMSLAAPAAPLPPRLPPQTDQSKSQGVSFEKLMAGQNVPTGKDTSATSTQSQSETHSDVMASLLQIQENGPLPPVHANVDAAADNDAAETSSEAETGASLDTPIAIPMPPVSSASGETATGKTSSETGQDAGADHTTGGTSVVTGQDATAAEGATETSSVAEAGSRLNPTKPPMPSLRELSTSFSDDPAQIQALLDKLTAKDTNSGDQA